MPSLLLWSRCSIKCLSGLSRLCAVLFCMEHISKYLIPLRMDPTRQGHINLYLFSFFCLPPDSSLKSSLDKPPWI